MTTADVAAYANFACSMTAYADAAQCVAKTLHADYVHAIAATSDYTSAEVLAACDAAGYAAAYARVAHINAQSAAYTSREVATSSPDRSDDHHYLDFCEACVSAYAAAANRTAFTEISEELLQEAHQARVEDEDQCTTHGIHIFRPLPSVPASLTPPPIPSLLDGSK